MVTFSVPVPSRSTSQAIPASAWPCWIMCLLSGVRKERRAVRQPAASIRLVLPCPFLPTRNWPVPLHPQRGQGDVSEGRQGDLSEVHRAREPRGEPTKTSNNSVAGKSAALFDRGMSFEKSLARTVKTLESLAEIKPSVEAAADLVVATLRRSGKLLIFGNGGSSAEASHLATELLGRFDANRRSLPAVALSSDGALITCIGNDYGFDQVFARQIAGLAKPGDMVVALTSSGKSAEHRRGAEGRRSASASTSSPSSGRTAAPRRASPPASFTCPEPTAAPPRNATSS